jgi:DNA-binding winged helix-turn-helix (wHTH) protein
MHTLAPKTLDFDIYTLDLQRAALRRGSEEVRLRPKSFDVLRYLTERAGRLVSKEELIQAIWPGIFVTDDSLVQCIRDIREALSDDGQRIIKTVPRRGYFFAAEVSCCAASPALVSFGMGDAFDQLAEETAC